MNSSLFLGAWTQVVCKIDKHMLWIIAGIDISKMYNDEDETKGRIM